MKMKAWTTSWATSFPTIIHVFPENDLKEHYTSICCHCNPRKDLNVVDMHITGVILVHNAYDGRP